MRVSALTKKEIEDSCQTKPYQFLAVYFAFAFCFSTSLVQAQTK
jgi:hypothetical protein